MQHELKSGDLGSASVDAIAELESARAVKRSPSGQLSVSIDDVSKTQTFQRDLQTLGRIRELVRDVDAALIALQPRWMDLALLFVLPLIGGFAFVTRFSLLRYTTGREESQRLYYRAALWGPLFAFGAGFLHWLLRSNWPAYDAGVDRFAAGTILALLEKDRTAASLPLSPAAVRIRVDVAVVCLCAFAAGAATPVWNGILRAADWLWVKGVGSGGQVRRSFLDAFNLRAIKDQLERLLAESLTTASPIQVTLNNSKVYVGNVLESIDPASPAKYFRIQPLMSGHRSSATGQVDYNTFYDNILAGLEEEEAQRRAATFQLIIPIDKVVSAAGFDFDAYEQFVLEQGAAERARAAEASATATQPPAAAPLLAPAQVESQPAGQLYKGWRIVPIAVAVNDHYAARFRLLREPEDGIVAGVDPFFAAGEFASEDEARAAAVSSAMITIDTSVDLTSN